MMTRWKWIMSALVVGLAACAGEDASYDEGGYNNSYGYQNNQNNASANNYANNATNNATNNGNVFIPEIEEEYDFSAPAVVGDRVFVANETLNAVAVIHSDTLRVENVPVGFMPTSIVGPANAETGNVWVLNEGGSSVTRIDATSLKTQTYKVLRRANAIATSASAEWAFAWFDIDRFEGTVPPEVDFATVTAVSAQGSYQLAVGFNVREVRFSDDGAFALVITDDGISRINLAELSSDALIPPIRLIDAEPQDQEVVVDPTGQWAVARANTQRALELVDLSTGTRTRIPMPEIPTDIDWVPGGKVLVSLPQTASHFVATVPEGLQNLADALAPVVQAVEMDAGMGDAGDAGVDADSADAGDMGGPGDMGADVGMPDGGDMDAGMADAAGDADVGTQDMGEDAGPGTNMLPDVDGVEHLALLVGTLGAAEVSPDGSVALFFSTLNDERRGVLWDFTKSAQDRVDFEKGIKGAVADTLGRAFVVLHSRVELPIPVGSTPLDPEYIERSWGISLLDVASGVSRLVLTSHEAGRSALWSDDAGLVKLYLGFKVPKDETRREDTQRDILVANLATFATSTFRLASFPEGLGLVGPARRIYVSQIHPQGRMTFIDVDSDERQTITGYQLNSVID